VRGVGLAEEGRGDEGCLHPFTGHHEYDEQEHPEPRPSAGPHGRGFQPRTDVAPQVLGRLQHVDHHGNDEHRGDQRQQGFPFRQDGDLGEPGS